MAHGVFDPGLDIYNWWQASTVETVWRNAVQGLVQSWYAGRRRAGLPDAPFRQVTASITSDEIGAAAKVGAVQSPFLQTGQVLAAKGRAAADTEAAEDLLYTLLHSALPTGYGWGSPLHFTINNSDLHGQADVYCPATWEGKVEDAAVNGTASTSGTGPFSIAWSGVPSDCNDGCSKFLSDSVSAFWAHRLNALRLVTPMALGHIASAIGREQTAAAHVTRNTRVALGVLVVAGAGAATWPYWGSYALRYGNIALKWGLKTWRLL
jgi:hypothetical protein